MTKMKNKKRENFISFSLSHLLINMKGKWFVGMISVLLITITLSGCISVGDNCFYLGFEEVKTPVFEELEIFNATHKTTWINTTLDIKDDYLVRSIRFWAINNETSEFATNVTIIIKEGEDELFNETTGNDGEAVFEATQGDTTVARPVGFKTTESHDKTAREHMVGDGKHIKSKNLTVEFKWNETEIPELLVPYWTTYYIYRVYESGEKEYMIAIAGKDEEAEPVANESQIKNGKSKTLGFNKTIAYGVNITVGSEGGWRNLTDGVNLAFAREIDGEEELFYHVFSAVENSISLQFYVKGIDKRTLGWFDDNETAMEAYEFIAETLTKEMAFVDISEFPPMDVEELDHMGALLISGGDYNVTLTGIDANEDTTVDTADKTFTVTIEFFPVDVEILVKE